jgi:ABC-2 type transport system permease protein
MKRIIEHRGFKNISSEVKMALRYIKINIASAAELRSSFVMQIIGMMVNNITFLAVWWLFLGTFGAINGWTGKEAIALQGFVAIAFGLSFSLFSGVDELPHAINNGVFDSILLTPRNLYMRILTLTTRPSAIGDTLYGFILLVIYIFVAHQTLLQSILLISFVIPATIILTNFMLVASCIGFFLPDSAELSRFTFEILLGPSMYPAGLYQGATRFVFLFILPALAIGGLPVEAVKNLNPWNIALVWLLAILWASIAVWVLKKGVTRYESSNLTGARI